VFGAVYRQFARRLQPVIALVALVLASSCPARASGDPSLVPISWALDVRHGTSSNVAVAVPWSFDYAHWQTTNSPPLLRFFPHVSLLGSGDAHAATLTRNPHFTMGCGFGFANALAFAVGVQINDPFAHAYIMAGLSLPDLAKLAF